MSYPQITFDLALTPHRVNWATEPFDLALRIGTLEDSWLVARRLVPLKVRVLVAPSYFANRALPNRPEDLELHDAIPTGWGHQRRVLDAVGWEVRRIALEGPVIAHRLGMTRMLVISGADMGTFDEAMSSQHFKQGRLEPLLPQWSLDRMAINAVTASQWMPEKTRVLVEHLAQEHGHFTLAWDVIPLCPSTPGSETPPRVPNRSRPARSHSVGWTRVSTGTISAYRVGSIVLPSHWSSDNPVEVDGSGGPPNAMRCSAMDAMQTML
jgi:hypothetical protein